MKAAWMKEKQYWEHKADHTQRCIRTRKGGSGMIEKIKKHIEEELATADRNSKKAVRVFVRTLREADLITREQKQELLNYIDQKWKCVRK